MIRAWRDIIGTNGNVDAAAGIDPAAHTGLGKGGAYGSQCFAKRALEVFFRACPCEARANNEKKDGALPKAPSFLCESFVSGHPLKIFAIGLSGLRIRVFSSPVMESPMASSAII